MIPAMRSKALALLILYFCFNLALAERWPIHLHRRDGPTTSSPTITDASSKPSASPTQSQESTGGDNGSDSTSSQAAKTSSSITLSANSTSSGEHASATTAPISITAVISNINGPAPTSSFNNKSAFNSTLTPGELPLTPEITPGFAVAGVILMLSGVAYTLIGIRNKWLHISLSAAYLASLSVSVLIIYVMNPPVSNAIQGAYVVAIVLTGAVLGGAAIIFKEMTEGLGCLLGGFCFSMWLLVLKPGGLLTTTGGISGFIAAFTLASFGTSFSHITRPYGLIVSISFGGATVVVLGIDCFSRAGLKEFWAYLWQLNDNLFPLGATTYPLTRGLRVEIAAIFIIFLAGIVSQMKLWKVIEAHREQRKAERLQDERTIEQEEENVGRRIEKQNARERNRWETVYGDKDAINSTEISNRDSGVGDMDSKKGAMSTVTSIRRSAEDDIEMADMPPTLTTGAGLVMASKGQDGGPITIRVARDVEVPQILDVNGKAVEPSANRLSHVSVLSSPSQKGQEEGAWVIGAEGEARFEKRTSPRNSKQVSEVPDVVPLPFKVPEEGTEDDRSSVATFADDEEGQKRKSHRLSTSSGLLRRLSKRSQRNSKRLSRGEGNSTEDLVVHHEDENDRASSVAATMDGLSDDEGSVRSSREHTRNMTEDMEAESANAESFDLEPCPPMENSEIPPQTTISTTAVGTEVVESAAEVVETVDAPQKSLTSSTDPRLDSGPSTPLEGHSDQIEKPATVAPSVVSAVESKPASITKDRLPAQLSKVVMSYRTNEWAKHLSAAEAPELEDLNVAENPLDKEVAATEAAAPVNVEELQQTPENSIPPPVRTMSQMANHAAAPIIRSGSAQSKRQSTSSSQVQDAPLSRSASQQSLHVQPLHQNLNTRGIMSRNSSSPNIPQSIVESPIEGDFDTSESHNILGASKTPFQNTPFGASHTLMGKRDTMLRNKSSFGNAPALTSTPEISQPSSDAGSVYNHPQIDDDNMSLSARRDLIRQSSLQSMSAQQQAPIIYDSHQPRRLSSAPSPMVREQQLASWRASVQNEFQSAVQPRTTIERQRSSLWQERQAEELKKAMDAKRKAERDSAFDQRMRRGDMLDAHREALRKMQATANKYA